MVEFRVIVGILRGCLLTTVVKEEGMSFVIGQMCKAVCYGRCAAYQRYKGTYSLKGSVVMEAACSSNTSILVYQIPPFQTPEHRSLLVTVWKPQISEVTRMFQYTRTSTQTHKNSSLIGLVFEAIWRKYTTRSLFFHVKRSHFQIAINNRFVKFLSFSRFI